MDQELGPPKGRGYELRTAFSWVAAEAAALADYAVRLDSPSDMVHVDPCVEQYAEKLQDIRLELSKRKETKHHSGEGGSHKKGHRDTHIELIWRIVHYDPQTWNERQTPCPSCEVVEKLLGSEWQDFLAPSEPHLEQITIEDVELDIPSTISGTISGFCPYPGSLSP